MKIRIGFGVISTFALALAFVAGSRLNLQASVGSQDDRPLAERVRHELVMLPFYTVFDNLQFSVNGDIVTLQGEVTRPVLKSDAESVARRITGVGKVVNKIEVLPLSAMDDRLRIAEYRSIYSGSGPLSRYGWGPVPPIHIIVDSGRVKLEGTVDRQTDKDMATLLANQVAGVFSVENDLTVKKTG